LGNKKAQAKIAKNIKAKLNDEFFLIIAIEKF
jgi:hypothetical protein